LLIIHLTGLKISEKIYRLKYFESISELFEFPDVDWEEQKENLTAGLVCETPLDPVPAEPSPKIIGGQTVPIEHHPYIGNATTSK
jgi:hypothetical protein